jgi:hypothetical protein
MKNYILENKFISFKYLTICDGLTVLKRSDRVLTLFLPGVVEICTTQ